MGSATFPEFIRLSDDEQNRLIAGARDRGPVRGLTHGFYKYPARFSPTFVRAAIETFTRPGDLVLDPHVGGGTTLVEARASGREAVGIDISSLAEFVANVKCTVFSDSELASLNSWTSIMVDRIDVRRPSTNLTQYAELGYYKHLNNPSRWRLRKGIEQALAHALSLNAPRLEAFGRCVVLRAAQWALDGRRKHTRFEEFRFGLEAIARQMLDGAHQFRCAVRAAGHRPTLILNRSAAGFEKDFRLRQMRPPRLVVTSPPYPGVHVLYHRWQVDGRKEAPLPFMIAGRLDGAGSSYYTMGDRKHPELRTYFENIHATMSSVANFAGPETLIVQMVAFSDPSWQLPRYLQTMEDAGLTELTLPLLKSEQDGRLWRSVPGRRWYSDQRGKTPGSIEVVLLHRKAAPARTARNCLMPPSRASLEAFAEA